MKKLLLTCAALLTCSGICIASIDKSYSDTYIHKLDLCAPYNENGVDTTIPTRDKDFPVIHIQTRESIIGIRNGKCATRSAVYAQELDGEIIVANCSFTEEQRKDLVKNMKGAKTDPKLKEQLQIKIKNYINNRPDVCQVRSLIEED